MSWKGRWLEYFLPLCYITFPLEKLKAYNKFIVLAIIKRHYFLLVTSTSSQVSNFDGAILEIYYGLQILELI